MAKKKQVNQSDIGFEKQIWDAACVLRGNMDASEYKHVVLGLIFLKYISDCFEEKYKKLVEEGEGYEEDREEYESENIFFVPENARWNVISEASHTEEIGVVIDEAMRSIEKENKKLKDILPKNFARTELDKRRLGNVVDLFTNIKMVDQGNTKDILGRTYEYCLMKFAEQEGKRAGEFYTPTCIVKTLVEVLQPFNGRVYDPCCGSGTTVVAAKLINRKWIGIDINLDAVEISNNRLKNLYKTESRLLKKGIESYKTKNDIESAILSQLNCNIVQRNKGIDGFLKKYYNDSPVAVKIQKDTESFSEAVELLKNAGEKKKCSVTVLIHTKKDNTIGSVNIPSNMIIIDDYKIQLEYKIESLI